MTLALAALLLSAEALAGGAATAPPGEAFERPLLAGGPGRVALRLDRDIYERARPDLGDLRLVDDAGRLVAFVIDGGLGGLAPELQPAVGNQGWSADGTASAVADFGGRRAKHRLLLRSTGDNFRRRVTVEGSVDGGSWTTLVDEAWVFAVPGPPAARYETVELPDNDFPLLRVSVRPAPDDRGRIRIADVRVPAEALARRREQELHPRWTRAEDPRTRETWLVVDLGARHQPVDSLALEVGEARFFREALVEARLDPPSVDAAAAWTEIARGALYRLEHDGRVRESLRLEACGRYRSLRVRIRNGDDRPLTIAAVIANAPLERIVFDAEAGRGYRLRYGSPRLGAPEFDLARTIGSVEAWARGAGEGVLGPPRRITAAQPPAPWTERHAGLVRAGLVLVVAALGALTWLALRRA